MINPTDKDLGRSVRFGSGIGEKVGKLTGFTQSQVYISHDGGDLRLDRFQCYWAEEPAWPGAQVPSGRLVAGVGDSIPVKLGDVTELSLPAEAGAYDASTKAGRIAAFDPPHVGSQAYAMTDTTGYPGSQEQKDEAFAALPDRRIGGVPGALADVYAALGALDDAIKRLDEYRAPSAKEEALKSLIEDAARFSRQRFDRLFTRNPQPIAIGGDDPVYLIWMDAEGYNRLRALYGMEPVPLTLRATEPAAPSPASAVQPADPAAEDRTGS